MEKSLTERAAFFTEAAVQVKNGDTVIAGVSGGADSICLLFLLCGLRESPGIDVRVVHVNHGIRKEAGEDEAFVKRICEEWHVPFTTVREDIPALALRMKCSEEEAGRVFRYEAFFKEADRICEEKGCGPDRVKIAVAHNMNDNAETVLFRLFRGTGINGLCGIRAVRSGKYDIIRPILDLKRSEIEKILTENGIPWVNDATNETDIYSRNRIRHRILPEAEKIVPAATEHIVNTASQLEEIEDLLGKLEEECFGETTLVGPDSVTIDTVKFMGYHIAIQKRVILKCLKLLSVGGKDLGTEQIDAILELIRKTGNRKLCLARGIRAVREYDRVTVFSKTAPGELQPTALQVSDKTAGTGGEIRAADREIRASGGEIRASGDPVHKDDGETFTAGCRLQSELFLLEELLKEDPLFLKDISVRARSNKYTKWLDYDKINGQAVLRTRQSGDYFFVCKPDGSFGKKSVKDYMIDRKIPPSERDKVLLAAVGSRVLWLIGYRISDDLMIGKDTKKVLKLSLIHDETGIV